jgi:hypothetical protein
MRLLANHDEMLRGACWGGWVGDRADAWPNSQSVCVIAIAPSHDATPDPAPKMLNRIAQPMLNDRRNKS